jgi:hypothetical protein
LIYAIEGLGQEFKEKISESSEDKELLEKLVADGKAVKDKEDVTVEEVKNETDRLQKESEPLFKKYAQTAQAEAPAGEKKEGDGPVEGEVVDA